MQSRFEFFFLNFSDQNLYMEKGGEKEQADWELNIEKSDEIPEHSTEETKKVEVNTTEQDSDQGHAKQDNVDMLENKTQHDGKPVQIGGKNLSQLSNLFSLQKEQNGTSTSEGNGINPDPEVAAALQPILSDIYEQVSNCSDRTTPSTQDYNYPLMCNNITSPAEGMLHGDDPSAPDPMLSGNVSPLHGLLDVADDMLKDLNATENSGDVSNDISANLPTLDQNDIENLLQGQSGNELGIPNVQSMYDDLDINQPSFTATYSAEPSTDLTGKNQNTSQTACDELDLTQSFLTASSNTESLPANWTDENQSSNQLMGNDAALNQTSMAASSSTELLPANCIGKTQNASQSVYDGIDIIQSAMTESSSTDLLSSNWTVKNQNTSLTVCNDVGLVQPSMNTSCNANSLLADWTGENNTNSQVEASSLQDQDHNAMLQNTIDESNFTDGNGYSVLDMISHSKLKPQGGLKANLQNQIRVVVSNPLIFQDTKDYIGETFNCHVCKKNRPKLPLIEYEVPCSSPSPSSSSSKICDRCVIQICVAGYLNKGRVTTLACCFSKLPDVSRTSFWFSKPGYRKSYYFILDILLYLRPRSFKRVIELSEHVRAKKAMREYSNPPGSATFNHIRDLFYAAKIPFWYNNTIFD